MSRTLLTLAFLLAFWLGGSVSGLAQAVLPPPFGLKWGDNPAKLLDWAERQKLDVTIKLLGAQPNSRHVIISKRDAKLPSHQATSLEARFHRGKLYEVTLHYADPKLSYARAKANFTEAKRSLGARHGSFKLSGKKRNSDNGFTNESITYHNEPVAGLFLMITFTEVKDTLRHTSRGTFSLIYHNENVIPKN